MWLAMVNFTLIGQARLGSEFIIFWRVYSMQKGLIFIFIILGFKDRVLDFNDRWFIKRDGHGYVCHDRNRLEEEWECDNICSNEIVGDG